MTKKRIGTGVVSILVLIACLWTFMSGKESEASGELVIVLDAGHDDSHTGAFGNGLREEYLNLQIAMACKHELETYEGVRVYMIRETGPCPYGGPNVVGSSAKCNLKRVEYAKSVGAHAYVSIHNNSSSNSSAKGAGVYYPSRNYNAAIGAAGGGLAQSVLDQLVALGLQDRKITVRYSEDNSRYPDGSLADYYGVIKNSKLRGFPGIIIEHAFVSNYDDATQYLNSLEKLWKLGSADATGIARYYGLKKKDTLDYSQAVISNNPIQNQTIWHLQASGIKNADKIQFAVWSDIGGFDDLIWYDGHQDAGGSWTADVPISNHKTEGIYRVDVYANGNICVGSSSFTVQGPSVESVQMVSRDNQKGTFDIELRNVVSGTDISSVQVAVWPKQDVGNYLRWINPVSIGNQSYRLQIDISDYGYMYGEYYVDVYASDRNGLSKCVSSQLFSLTRPEGNLEVNGSEAGAVFEVRAWNLPYGNAFSQVSCSIWVNDENKNGTPLVYSMEEDSYHQWRTCIYPAELGMDGTYTIQLKGTLPDGQTVILGEAAYTTEREVYEILGGPGEENHTVYNWKDIYVMSQAAPYQLRVQPWCDYGRIRSALEASAIPYKELLAFHMQRDWLDQPTDAKEVNTVSFEAVTGDGAVREALPQTESITITIPPFMRDREVRVYTAKGDSMEFGLTEAEFSEDGSRVTIKAEPEGYFVLAAEKPRMKGDANTDGKITFIDARMILRAVLKIEALDDKVKKYCDINEDGQITLEDVQSVLKTALGIQ